MVRLRGYDFKGNLLEKERQVVADAVFTDQWAAQAGLNWAALPTGFHRHWDDLNDAARLAPRVYATSTAYDALNRATRLTLPVEAPGPRPQLVPTYNRAGALAQVALDGQVLVARVAYNARGQRLLLARGNGLLTRYAYDPVSFRLLRLRTEGYTNFGETLTPQAGTVRQDTGYGYDLAGNITATVERAAQSGVGGAAELERLFAYDALYRLVAATGRENQPTAATPWQDQTRSDGVASTTAYKQLYQYDLLGNLQQLAHRTNDSATYFTRQFTYPSITNRLQLVAVGRQQLAYAYDASGNVVQEQQSRHLQWDASDQLRQFATWTGAGSAPTLLAYYVYDAGGQRSKKLTQTAADTWQVTVYVDGSFEHRYEVSNGTPSDEQTIVYVLDGPSRLYQHRSGDALGDQRPAELYTLEDHLGSAAATVDAGGALVSREEYYPFGETSFGSHEKQRYRFCGKERDQESGLYYYGMRYYAPWLCRFVSVDPLAEKYTYYTPYQYAGNKPVTYVDIDGSEEGPTPLTTAMINRVRIRRGIPSDEMGYVLEATFRASIEKTISDTGSFFKFYLDSPANDFIPAEHRLPNNQISDAGYFIKHVRKAPVPGGVGVTRFYMPIDVKSTSTAVREAREQIIGYMKIAAAEMSRERALVPPFTPSGSMLSAKDVGAASVLLVVPEDADVRQFKLAAIDNGVNLLVSRMFVKNGEIGFTAPKAEYITPQAKKNGVDLTIDTLPVFSPVPVQYEEGHRISELRKGKQ